MSFHLTKKLTAKRIAKISVASPTPTQKPQNSFPAWRLPNGTINASETQLESASSSCERWEWGCAGAVVVAVIAEFAIAAIHPPYDSFLEQWGSAVADTVIALGIVGEVLFSRTDARIQTELRKRSNAKLADAIKVAGNANERAAKADLARAKLEAQLQPRSLNQEQWNLIQSLRGKFERINIAFETDAETRWFANVLSLAFMAAEIKVITFPRASDIHTFGTMIYEPRGFDGSRPRTVEPLIEIFRRSDPPSVPAIITGIPKDISAQGHGHDISLIADVPMIILGGRFNVPPDNWPKPSALMESAISKIATRE